MQIFKFVVIFHGDHQSSSSHYVHYVDLAAEADITTSLTRDSYHGSDSSTLFGL